MLPVRRPPSAAPLGQALVDGAGAVFSIADNPTFTWLCGAAGACLASATWYVAVKYRAGIDAAFVSAIMNPGRTTLDHRGGFPSLGLFQIALALLAALFGPTVVVYALASRFLRKPRANTAAADAFMAADYAAEDAAAYQRRVLFLSALAGVANVLAMLIWLR